jgi:hypothetical protein
MEFICDRLNEFVELFIDGSSIELVEYNNKTKRWTISYSYDMPSDEFESVEDMIKFLQSDQNNE